MQQTFGRAIRALFLFIGVVALSGIALALFITYTSPTNTEYYTAHVIQSVATTTPAKKAFSETTPQTPEPDANFLPKEERVVLPTFSPQSTTPPETVAPASPPEPAVAQTPPPTPYDTPTLSFDVVNRAVRPALVNILCSASTRSAFSGASGTGVIIDPRGIILTNAHVAQYFLLRSHPQADIECVVRTGAPAKPAYNAELLFFPEMWLNEHARDIRLEFPTGTGEHDWALLYVTQTIHETKRPGTFPFVTFDTREAIARPENAVLLAGYPTGFIDSATLTRNLWPVSTTAAIQNVFTFTQSNIDVLSFGGTIVAQSGSSGGAAVNPWGRLVGLLTTSTLRGSTDMRDLRAISLAHINRSALAHTEQSLLDLLQEGNFGERTEAFARERIPALLTLYDTPTENE